MTGYSVTVQDAEYTPNDRLAAFEYQAERDLRCSGCGQPRDESMRPEVIDGQPNPAFIEYNATGIVCQSCLATDRTASAVAGAEQVNPLGGVLWQTEPVRRE